MRIGRNSPCFCGSRKKYKNCCLRDSKYQFGKHQYEKTIFSLSKKELIQLLKKDIKAWNQLRSNALPAPTNDSMRDMINNASLPILDLSNCDFSCCNLSGANLSRIKFDDSNFFAAKLHDVDLTTSSLLNANLENAIITSSTLLGANLSGANLINANLENSNINRVVLGGWKGKEPAQVDGACLKGVSYALDKYQFWSPAVGGDPYSGGVLELAVLPSLTNAVFDQAEFDHYIEKAFKYAHTDGTLECWNGDDGKCFRETAIKAITALTELYSLPKCNEINLQEIMNISSEIVSYIKKKPNDIFLLSPRKFEELIAELLSSFGWDVQLTSTTRDGGYDIFGVNKISGGIQTSMLVECKRYQKKRTVGIDIARSLYGVKNEYKVAHAMLATTSRFSKGVHNFKASRYDFSLRDYEGILEWVNQYNPHPSGRWYVDQKSGITLPGRKC